MFCHLVEEIDRRPKLALASAIVIVAIAWWTSAVATAWTDEVFYVDPGACLALGKGFTSNGWSELGGGSSWGLSNPGVPILMAGWFGVLGFGQYQSHAFFFLIQLSGALLIIRWACQRWNLSPAEKIGILLICLFLHSVSGATMYHARPDAFALLLYGWFVNFSFPSGKPGLGELISSTLFGVACVFLGLQFCGYFPLVAATVFAFVRSRHLFNVGLGQALGLGLGMLLLRICYGMAGTWDSFVSNRSDHIGQEFAWGKFFISKDFVVLAPALLLVVCAELWRGWVKPGRVMVAALYAVCIMILVPLYVIQIGVYQQAYSWMVAVPVLLIVLPAVARLDFAKGSWVRWLVVSMAMGSVALRSFAVPGELSDSQNKRAMLEELRYRMKPEDLVLASVPLYYEMRASGSRVVWPYDFRLPPAPRVKKDLRWALITESDQEVLKHRLPGSWEEIAERPDMIITHKGARYLLLRRTDAE